MSPLFHSVWSRNVGSSAFRDVKLGLGVSATAGMSYSCTEMTDARKRLQIIFNSHIMPQDPTMRRAGPVQIWMMRDGNERSDIMLTEMSNGRNVTVPYTNVYSTDTYSTLWGAWGFTFKGNLREYPMSGYYYEWKNNVTINTLINDLMILLTPDSSNPSLNWIYDHLGNLSFT